MENEDDEDYGGEKDRWGILWTIITISLCGFATLGINKTSIITITVIICLSFFVSRYFERN